MSNNKDFEFLLQALEWAKIRRGFCAPNPSVGSVIVLDNQVIAHGYHHAAGFPHAEIEALKKLNHRATHATQYVTLEPCCHWGRTPPCTEALIKAGIQRVVYAYQDPNPIVAGKGEEALRAAGIQCHYIEIPEIHTFYKSYHYWQQTKMPWVTAKIAISLDGKIAGPEGQRIQLTGEALQQFTHACRKKSDAILTTARTVIHDDPQLNVRYEDEIIAKPLYVLDTHLNLPRNAQVLSTAKNITLFHSNEISPERVDQWLGLGVRCIAIEQDSGGLNLTQVLKAIGNDGVHDLWVEAGGQCFTHFMQQDLLHSAFIYIAPKMVGEGIPAFPWPVHRNFQSIRWAKYEDDIVCELNK